MASLGPDEASEAAEISLIWLTRADPDPSMAFGCASGRELPYINDLLVKVGMSEGEVENLWKIMSHMPLGRLLHRMAG